jgi:hypothetical protein
MTESGITAPAAAKRRRRWLIPVIAAVVVLVAGGGTASYLLLARGDGEVEDGDASASTVETFADMGSADPDLAAARSSVGYGLFAADADGRFRPADPVSRAEFASFVVTVFDLESPVPRSPTFSDVPVTHPDYLAVEAASPYFFQSEGASQARGLFAPDDPVGRGVARQIVRLLVQNSAPDLAASLPAGDATDADQALSRADAAHLLIPAIEGRQPPAADIFEATGIN